MLLQQLVYQDVKTRFALRTDAFPKLIYQLATACRQLVNCIKEESKTDQLSQLVVSTLCHCVRNATAS